MAIAASGCGTRARPPVALVDGTPVVRAPVEIEGANGPALLASVRVVRVPDTDPVTASCAAQRWSDSPAGPAVVRVGVDGESVTLGSRSRRGVHGCDASGRAARAHRWCGVAYGLVVGGRVRDPRLDLAACRNESDRTIAFAWIDPQPGTRYVVVRRHGFAEVYRTAGDLPVRVATTDDIDVARSRARFRISEHAADGRLLLRYELTAQTAG